MSRATTEREYARTPITRHIPQVRSCDACTYPADCARDKTCWKAEKQAIAELKASPKTRGWTAETCLTAIQAWHTRTGHVPTSEQWQSSSEDHPGCGTVARFYGTWGAGLIAAGFAPAPRWGRRKIKR